MSPYLLFMAKKELVKELTHKALSENEFFVDCTVSKDNKISVFVDGFNNFGIDQCKRISRFIESGLDRDKEDFDLTVSTPGLDRDFKVHQQYVKSEGEKIELTTEDLQKQIVNLDKVNDNEIEISYKENKREIKEKITFKEIKKAKPHINF